MSNDTIERLQRWYQAQCNGKWEHGHGVRIETLDNPGWMVKIDLRETRLNGKPFETIDKSRAADRWVHCSVKGTEFVAAGAPMMLDQLLSVFLEWAERVERD